MAFESLRCGRLGRTLGHSYSPAIHKELAGYSYRLFEIGPMEQIRQQVPASPKPQCGV